MSRDHPALGALLAAALLAGCAGAPPFSAPAPPATAHYGSAGRFGASAAAPLPHGQAQQLATGLPGDAAWWQALGSPALDALIAQAWRASPTLAAAQATQAQAQAQEQALSGATELPRVDAQIGAQRQLSNPAAQGQGGAGRAFDLYSASVGVRYAFDLSGANRSQLQALAARSQWRGHELDGARLTLAGQIASGAILRARLAAQIADTQTLLAGQTEQLQLAHARERLGQAAPDEALALATQAAQTRAALPPLHQQLQQADHLLATLAGSAPGAAPVHAFALRDFTLPATLPLVVPSELVRQRPDIRASEALLHAAHAERSAVVARRYPQLNLSASVGSQALSAGALFGAGSAVWALAGQLGAPLFNAAQPAEERAAQAAFDAAHANYQSVVLQALRSVADVLRAIEHSAQTLQALAAADASAQASLQLTEQRLRLGAASHVQLLLAQQQASQTRLQLSGAQAQRLLDSVALYQAMGVGPKSAAAPPLSAHDASATAAR